MCPNTAPARVRHPAAAAPASLSDMRMSQLRAATVAHHSFGRGTTNDMATHIMCISSRRAATHNRRRACCVAGELCVCGVPHGSAQRTLARRAPTRRARHVGRDGSSAAARGLEGGTHAVRREPPPAGAALPTQSSSGVGTRAARPAWGRGVSRSSRRWPKPCAEPAEQLARERHRGRCASAVM